MIRAVIDLNVIISAIISQLGIPHQIWSDWLSDQRFELVISEGIILELADKLATPRIARRYGVRARHVRSTASLLRAAGSLVAIPEDGVAPVTATRRMTWFSLPHVAAE